MDKSLAFTEFDPNAMNEGEVAPSGPLAHLLRQLNGGPDLSDAVHEDERLRLPLGWRLNTVRVSLAAIKARDDSLERLVSVVFDSFEAACSELIAQSPEVNELVQQGVECEPQLKSLYVAEMLPFRARRLDTVVDAAGRRWVVENDEQPGGLPIVYHLDTCFGVNEARWSKVWGALTEHGCLVFLVSNSWGGEYISETRWLAERLILQGYEAYFISTTDAECLKVEASGGVTIHGRPVSIIWRQFPVFEASGHLVQLVRAAAAGPVQMFPPVASWGNKVWFALFWEHQDFFRNHMKSEFFEQLKRCLPYSKVIHSVADFPVGFATATDEISLASADSLIGLAYSTRRKLVVKAAGANRFSARSKGVVIGQDRDDRAWQAGIINLLRLNSCSNVPIIIQEYHAPRVVRIPVYNAEMRTFEMVEMRFLERPWYVAGTVVSSVSYASPAAVLKLHATVDGCEIPRQL